MSQRRNAPITVSLRVNQVETTMEVDTGASVSIMSETTYQKLWPEGNFPLQPSDAKLRTYTGESLCILGSIPAHVQYADQEASRTLLVVSEMVQAGWEETGCKRFSSTGMLSAKLSKTSHKCLKMSCKSMQ